MHSSQPREKCFTHVVPVMSFLLLEFRLHSSQSNPILEQMILFKTVSELFPAHFTKVEKNVVVAFKREQLVQS